MPLMGNALLVRRLFTASVYRFSRLLFTVVQRIFWELNGTARQVREARRPENYDRCAQVLNVHAFHKLCPLQNTAEEDFVCTHSGLVSPQYIIDNDHVTLMTINDNYAIFSESEKPGVHLWRFEYGSFMRVAQMELTRRMIRVPLDAFHRMSETIGDPKTELVFLFNTARCGSTLFVQIMQSTGRCVALSEPDSPNLIAMKYRKYGDTPEVRQLARDVIRWECRPYPSLEQPPLAYAIKLTSPSAVGLPLYRELFPNSKCLFMYRDMISMSRSLYRLSQALPSLRLAYILGRISGRLTEAVIDSMGFCGEEFRIRLVNDLSMGVVCGAISIRCYVRMRQTHPKFVSALRYEDLVAAPLEMCRAIVQYCGLPVSLAELAVKGMELDSQRNAPYHMRFINTEWAPKFTPDVEGPLNEIMATFGLPPVAEFEKVEGILTAS